MQRLSWGVTVVLVFWWWRVFNDEQASTLKMAVAWVVVSSALGFQWWLARRAARQFHQRQLDCARLYSAGRFNEFLGVVEKGRVDDPGTRLQVAVTKLFLWRLGAAANDFEPITTAQEARGPIATSATAHLALTEALRGRLEASRGWLSRVPQGEEPALCALTRAVLDVRSTRWPNARGELASFPVKQLGGPIGALARGIEAMAIEASTNELRHVDRIALFGEASSEELERGWPEFIAAVHRLPPW